MLSIIYVCSLLFVLSSAASENDGLTNCSAVTNCLRSNDTCNILPLPDTTMSEPFQPANFSLTEVRRGVYAFNDGLYVSLMIFENGRLALIDCPHNFLERLPNGELKLNAAVHQVLNGSSPRRVDIIYSHADADHFGNAGEIVANLTGRFPEIRTVIWGTEETRQRLRNKDAKDIPQVQRIISTYTRSLQLSCSLSLEMSMIQGHSLGDVLIHIPRWEGQPSLSYLVDYVWPGFAPIEHFGFPADFGAYIRSLERLKNLGAKVLIPGHWTVGSNADVIKTLEYAQDALIFAEEAGKEITPEEQAAQNIPAYFTPGTVQYGNTAFFFRQFADLQASICERKLISKYGCKLGGVAVNSLTHCKIATFWLLTNTL